MSIELKDIRSFLPSVYLSLLSKPNVIGTGIGYKITNGKQTNELSIICSVGMKQSSRNLSDKDKLPETVDGVPLDVIPTGIIYALTDPKKKHRPAPGGVSVGHYLITAGTLGCWVKKKDKYCILSNNHVLANSNSATIGDPILQPGPIDGGQHPKDLLANLSEFIPITFDSESPCPTAKIISYIINWFAKLIGSRTRLQSVRTQSISNTVDAAIAECADPKDVKNEILNIGTPTGISEGELGMSIKKMGRTTGLTEGSITQIDATVRVNYGANKIATFSDQLIAGPISQGGDSGSAVLDNRNQLIGLLFAGSTNVTILNRIQNVFDQLGISL